MVFDFKYICRTHLEERENAEQDRAVAERNLSNLTTELCRLLFVEYNIGGASDHPHLLSTDEIIHKVSSLQVVMGPEGNIQFKDEYIKSKRK